MKRLILFAMRVVTPSEKLMYLEKLLLWYHHPSCPFRNANSSPAVGTALAHLHRAQRSRFLPSGTRVKTASLDLC
jgi:hypothetical protein